jgi:nitrile hydratase
VHDVGGQTGFGPVPVSRDVSRDAGQDGAGHVGAGSPPFRADWEARVFALAGVLGQRGVFTGDELRDAIESLPPERYLSASYYERWLDALEVLVARKGVR